MKIGIVGAGAVGSALARHVLDAGHDVAISNSRGPASLEELVDDLGPNAQAATVTETAEFGEIVVDALPFGEHESLPADELAHTTVVSTANYEPDRDGDLSLDGQNHTEAIAAHLPDARVMKAFNTMDAETLRDGAKPDEPLSDRLAVFIVGNDALSKATVMDLVEEIGFAPIDLGPLSNGSLLEPGSRLYGEAMTLDDAESLLQHLTN